MQPRGYQRTLTHGDNPVSRLDVNHMMYDRGQKAMKSLGLSMDKDGDLRAKEVHYRETTEQISQGEPRVGE